LVASVTELSVIVTPSGSRAPRPWWTLIGVLHPSVAACAKPSPSRADRRGRNRGQSLVEVALVLPLFLTLTLGTADGGRAFYYREAVSNASRQALRVAVSSSQQGTGDTACTGKGTSSTAVSAALPASNSSSILTIANAAALESSGNGTAAGSTLSGATLTVTWHCAADKAITNASATSTDPGNSGSDAVEVRITYPFTLITPLVSRLMNSGNPTIGADVIGRAEY
jgi:Flp pilus assembly protein TadG